MTSRPDPRPSGPARWLMVAALLACSAPAAALCESLQPYKARYQVSYRGVSGGQIESSLSRGTATGQWLYETRAHPNLFGLIAVSHQARERSVMQVTPEGVRPVSFDFNDGSADKAKDVRFAFDWTAGHVRGEAAGVPFDLPVKPGTQDTASVQAEMLVDLLARRTPLGYPILTRSAGGRTGRCACTPTGRGSATRRARSSSRCTARAARPPPPATTGSCRRTGTASS